MITSFFSPKGGKAKGGKANTSANESASLCDDRKRSNDNNDTNKSKRCKSASGPAAPIFGGTAPISTGPLSTEVEDLLSYMDGAVNDDDDGSERTWRQALDKHVRKSNFNNLAKFVANERKNGKKIYPPKEDVFSALNLTPLRSVKVVIVGQDPYHGPGQGHGLAFSVRRGMQIPPSLRNIYKELMNDANVSFPSKPPSHGYLMRWAKQGVLMLNTALTVRGGEANSHKNRGWESFTDECIRAIDRECRTRKAESKAGSAKGGIVFLLWGKPASKKAEGVISKSLGHEIIATSHPSPLGATKTSSPFLGSKCFSRANAALIERGLEPIDWNVDD